jgi:large subunit ribosomal protein L22e
LDVAHFEKYLHDRIKIGKKTGQLAAKLTVSSPQELGFSKRQLKYLSKRYLKKQQLKEYMRVVASSEKSYELKYYEVQGGDDDDEE